jgi:hypothetical protein
MCFTLTDMNNEPALILTLSEKVVIPVQKQTYLQWHLHSHWTALSHKTEAHFANYQSTHSGEYGFEGLIYGKSHIHIQHHYHQSSCTPIY